MSDEVFDNLVLDEEEQWIEEHLEEFVPVENQKKMRKQLMKAAKNTLKDMEKQNKKMLSLRLEQDDIASLKGIAKEQGLPYQSLIGSIIHRFVNGTLVDITEAKKIFSVK